VESILGLFCYLIAFIKEATHYLVAAFCCLRANRHSNVEPREGENRAKMVSIMGITFTRG
jgi:hypothetical protein